MSDIDTKIDKLFDLTLLVQSDVNDIKITNAVQNEQLKEHIRRTEIAENRIDIIDKKLEPLLGLQWIKDNMRWIIPSVGFLGAALTAYLRYIGAI